MRVRLPVAGGLPGLPLRDPLLAKYARAVVGLRSPGTEPCLYPPGSARCRVPLWSALVVSIPPPPTQREDLRDASLRARLCPKWLPSAMTIPHPQPASPAQKSRPMDGLPTAVHSRSRSRPGRGPSHRWSRRYGNTVVIPYPRPSPDALWLTWHRYTNESISMPIWSVETCMRSGYGLICRLTWWKLLGAPPQAAA
jgi:hypothetical protein